MGGTGWNGWNSGSQRCRYVLCSFPKTVTSVSWHLFFAVTPLETSLQELALRRAVHDWFEGGKEGPCGPDEVKPFWEELKSELSSYVEERREEAK